MSKPEVVATTFTMAAIAAPSIGQQITHASVKVDMPAGTELIRLTDHEAAMAEVVDLSGMRASSLANVSMERNELLGLLRQVYSDLPSRRDWLDPVLEAQIKDTLERHKC